MESMVIQNSGYNGDGSTQAITRFIEPQNLKKRNRIRESQESQVTTKILRWNNC